MVLKGGKIAVTVDADGVKIDTTKDAEGIVVVEIIGGAEKSQRIEKDLKALPTDRRPSFVEQLATRSTSLDDCEVRMAWRLR